MGRTHGCEKKTGVDSAFHPFGMVKWVSAFQLSNNNKWRWWMWMVAAIYRRTHSPSRLAWSEGWRPPGAQSAFIKMNRVNSCSDHGDEDSTINIVVDYYYYIIKIEGRMRGKATRDRKRMHLLNDLMEGMYVALKRTAEDRKEWHKLKRAGTHRRASQQIIGRLILVENFWGLMEHGVFTLSSSQWCQSTEGDSVLTPGQWSGLIISSSITDSCVLTEGVLLPLCKYRNWSRQTKQEN